MGSAVAHLVVALTAAALCGPARADVRVERGSGFVPLESVPEGDAGVGALEFDRRWPGGVFPGRGGAGGAFEPVLGHPSGRPAGWAGTGSWALWDAGGAEAGRVVPTAGGGPGGVVFGGAGRGRDGPIVEGGAGAASWSGWPRTETGRAFEQAALMSRFARLPGPGSVAVVGVACVLAGGRRR
jgi:hypothetical protein